MSTPAGWLIDGKVHCTACCDGPMFSSEDDTWIPLDDADPADILHADDACPVVVTAGLDAVASPDPWEVG